MGLIMDSAQFCSNIVVHLLVVHMLNGFFLCLVWDLMLKGWASQTPLCFSQAMYLANVSLGFLKVY